MSAKKLTDEIVTQVENYRAMVYQTAPSSDTDENAIMEVLENIKRFLDSQEIHLMRSCVPHANKLAVQRYQPATKEGCAYMEAYHMAVQKRDEQFLEALKAL